jgi:hypothetical protein
MRNGLTSGSLVALMALLATACVVEPPAGARPAPLVGVMAGDARANQYGATGGEVLDHPALREKIVGLFGPDWKPAPESGGKLASGAAAFFARSSPPQLVRMEGANFIAVAGCLPSACAASRGLILIREDTDLLMARVDEGGYAHYYVWGAPATRATTGPTVIDSAWRALERASGSRWAGAR